MKTKDGVVLGVEKRITHKLMEKSSVEKIREVDFHIGAAISGLSGDARTLIEHARVEAQNHRFTYDEPLRPESLCQSVSDLMMSFGEGGKENKSKMSRPFGVSLLMAGVDRKKGAQLFCVDPSGTFVEYKAHAIGSGAEGARGTLEDKWSAGMSISDAEVLVAKVLRATMEERVTDENIEIATVTPTGGYSLYTREQLADVLARAEAAADDDDEAGEGEAAVGGGQ